MNKALIYFSIFAICIIAVNCLKQGSCPAPGAVGICIQGCNIDEDCSGTKKCVRCFKY